MQRHLYEHYSRLGHCEHISITLIEKTNPSDPLKKEYFWRRTLCTMASYDLNIEDNVWSIPL